MCLAKKPNYLKVIYMSVILMLHLSLCLSLVSLLPEIAKQNGYEDLGNLAVILFCFGQLIDDVIGPAYLKFFNFKFGFTLQALLTTPVFFTSHFVTNCKNLPGQDTICSSSIITPLSVLAGGLLGIGLAGYFIVQNYYISKCSTKATQDLYFSTSYAMMGLSFLIGGIISETGIKAFGRDQYFLIAGCTEIGLSLCFLFVMEPDKARVHEKALNATLAEDSQHSHLNRRDSIISEMELHQKQTISQNLKEMWAQVKNPELLPLYPTFLATGVIIGFEYTLLYQFITETLKPENLDDETVNKMTARVFQFGGLGQISGALAFFGMKSFLNTKQYTVFYSNYFQMALIISIADTYLLKYYIVCVLEYILGLTDITGQLICTTTISEDFHDSMSVIGIYLFCQNLAVALVAGFETIFGTELIYCMVVVAVFQVALNFSSHYALRRNEKL